MLDINRALRRYRDDLGLTQKEMAECVGVHENTIFNLEHYKFDITIKVLMAYAEFQGLTLSEFIKELEEFDAEE